MCPEYNMVADLAADVALWLLSISTLWHRVLAEKYLWVLNPLPLLSPTSSR